MKAIMIDDEKPALALLEKLLQEDGRIEIAGKYTSAKAGLEHLRKERADIVFLDIGMPEMNGLKAAEHIQQWDRSIRIVYITAYSDYAIDAFELNALDYILKPIHPQRLAKTLDRLLNYGAVSRPAPARTVEGEPAVLCFKRLELQGGTGKDKRTRLKWRTAKAQELFAYLLHHQGQWVVKDRLLETLWPEYTLDKALTHLHGSVSQIRRLIKEWGVQAAVEFAQDSYRLTKEGLLTDVDLFEKTTALRENNPDRLSYDRILSLYRGDYLEEHDYPWAKSKRIELQQKYTQAVLRLVSEKLRSGEERQALLHLRTLQEREPYSEEICRLTMTAYAQLKSFHALRLHYETFAGLLQSELGIEPDRETREWYARCMAQV